MAVYRKHSGGVWAGCGETDDWFLRCGIPLMRFYKEMEKSFNVNKEKELLEMGRKTINVLLKNKNFSDLDLVSNEFSNFWDKLTFVDTALNKKYRKLEKRNRILKFILGILLITNILFVFY